MNTELFTKVIHGILDTVLELSRYQTIMIIAMKVSVHNIVPDIEYLKKS